MSISSRDLSSWTQLIVQYFNPERIVLFGSYAVDQQHANSDIDLLVVMPYEDRPFQVAARIRRVLRTLGGYVGALDVLVRSPDEMERRLAVGDHFLSDILTYGKVLYDAKP